MKNLIVPAFLIAFTTASPGQTKGPATPNKSTTNTIGLEYLDKAGRNRPISEYSSNTFYTYNAKDDPTVQPTVGIDNETSTKFIEIKGIKQIPYINPKLTWTTLIRYIKIPENAPKTISIKVTHRYQTQDSDFTWLPGGQKTNPFMRVQFTDEWQRGGGCNILLQPNIGWQHTQHNINIPTGAKYMIVELRSYHENDKVAIGGWTIE
jgi:hypothetical protein